MRRTVSFAWLGLSLAACAAPTLKTEWPVDHELAATSVAQGGPLVDERPNVVTLGPPVEIQYAPMVRPGKPARSPQTLMLTWPLPATGVTSMYGFRTDPVDGVRRFHRGIDMEAEYGATVKASERGQVVAAGWNGGFGRQVVIEHPGGFQTTYAHLSRILVTLSSRVQAGEPIGLVGTSGRSTGAHLHFEVTQWNQHLDPLDVLGVEMTVR